MIEIKIAKKEDVERLTETQVRAFVDDNKFKPPGSSLEGPPGYDSVDWNSHWVENTPYYKIEYDGQVVGGLILFDQGGSQFEVGRIWVDPAHQNKGIGQAALRAMFSLHPDVEKWTLGTPSWAHRSQHVYEKVGFVNLRETEVDPNHGWSGFEYELVCD
jgi:RimJ/RimL family protein N-acetyltransferase